MIDAYFKSDGFVQNVHEECSIIEFEGSVMMVKVCLQEERLFAFLRDNKLILQIL